MKSKKPAPATHEPAVTVELPEDMLRALDRLAHRERITRSEVIRRMVEKALAAEAPQAEFQRQVGEMRRSPKPE
jgi:metal-responsive CopG/Arc/MetJ family transcriptional regulator